MIKHSFKILTVQVSNFEFNYDFRELGVRTGMGIIPCIAMAHWLRDSLMGMEVSGRWLWARHLVTKQNIRWSDPKIS